MDCEEINLETKNDSKILIKLKSIALTTVLVMLSLGAWNDTKQALVDGYEIVISHFTNEIEYKRINKLRIGLTAQYTKEILGSAQVIKPSHIVKGLKYFYYDSNKFVIATFIKDQRLTGFTVISKNPEFYAPLVYISKQLNNGPINEYLPTQDTILTNTGSLEYFAESYELSRDLMFYNLLLGYVNYEHAESQYSQTIIDANQKLNMGEDVDLTSISFSAPLVPNFYAISELSNEIMQESLLSRYEMNALFGMKY